MINILNLCTLLRTPYVIMNSRPSNTKYLSISLKVHHTPEFAWNPINLLSINKNLFPAMKNLLVTLDVEGRSQGLLRKDNKTYFRNSLITICTEKRMNQDC